MPTIDHDEITTYYKHLVSNNRNEVSQDEWDSFVDCSNEAWLWHRFDLQDAISTWPGKRDLSFAVKDISSGGQIVAVVPLHLIERRRMFTFKWNSLDSLGGPACINELGNRQKHRILGYILSQIIALARKYDAVEMNMALSPLAPAYCGERCPKVNPLLELGCENTLTQTWVVDLRQGEEAIWVNMENRARTAIRKGEKEGLTIRPANRPNDLEVYYSLHCDTYNRTRAHPHPKAYFEAIWSNFVSKGFSYILFAEWNGKVVAAENFGIYKKASVYWTGAASNQGLLLQANSLLQWTAMKSMIENGIMWYETGEAFPGARGGKSKGLNDFKRSFGGKLFPYYRGRIIFNPKWYSLWRFVHTWRTNT
jgi:hypothetical protein